jgi:hypothetical protein
MLSDNGGGYRTGKGRTYCKITAAKPANGASMTATNSAPAAGTASEAESQFVRELLAVGQRRCEFRAYRAWR